LFGNGAEKCRRVAAPLAEQYGFKSLSVVFTDRDGGALCDMAEAAAG